MLRRTSKYEEALAAAERAVHHARQTGNDGLLVESAIEQAVALSMLSRLTDAVTVMEEVVPIAERSNDLAAAFSATVNLGGAYEDVGKIRECLDRFERGLEMARQLGRPAWIAASLLDLARIHYRHGKWDRAWEETQEALSICRKAGAVARLPAILYSLGVLCVFRGRWDEMTECMDEARTTAEAMGDVALLRWVAGFTAQGDILQGQPEVARDRLAPLLDRGQIEESEVTWLLPVVAWSYLECGDLEQARAASVEVLRRARESRNQIALADALWVGGKIATHDRRWDEARQLFEEGIALNRDISFYWAEVRTSFEYGLMLLAAGEQDRGRERVGSALEVFRRLRAAPYISRARDALSAAGSK